MDEMRPAGLPDQFAHSVRLDRSYYSRYYKITAWLGQQLGSSFPEYRDGLYSVDQVFGYTTVYFVNDSDRAHFALVWL